MQSATLSAQDKIKYPWMLSCQEDLIYFLTPNILAFAIYIMALVSPSRFAGAIALMLIFYAGNVIHQGATWFHYMDKRNREYYLGTTKQRVKFIVLPILVLTLAIVGGIVWYPFVWLVYMAWSLPHFTQQNAGILLLYHNHKQGEAIVPRNLEMRSQQLAGLFFYLVAIHRCSLGNTDVAVASSLLCGIVGVAALVGVLMYLANLFTQVRNGAYLNMPAFLFWIASVLFFLPFALPGIMDFEALWILPSLMHWLQYVGLNYVLVRRKYAEPKQIENLPVKKPIVFFVGFCLSILVIQYGSFLFSHAAWPEKPLLSIWSSVFLGLGMVHYLLDGFIWKFREPYNRETILTYLVEKK